MACKSFSLVGYTSTLCNSKSGADIPVSITTARTTKTYWKMYLRRAGSGEVWNVVGTRSGYVSSSSRSDRTFTNVGGYGSAMDVLVDFYSDSSYNYKIDSVVSDTFIR